MFWKHNSSHGKNKKSQHWFFTIIFYCPFCQQRFEETLKVAWVCFELDTTKRAIDFGGKFFCFTIFCLFVNKCLKKHTRLHGHHVCASNSMQRKGQLILLLQNFFFLFTAKLISSCHCNQENGNEGLIENQFPFISLPIMVTFQI